MAAADQEGERSTVHAGCWLLNSEPCFLARCPTDGSANARLGSVWEGGLRRACWAADVACYTARCACFESAPVVDWLTVHRCDGGIRLSRPRTGTVHEQKR